MRCFSSTPPDGHLAQARRVFAAGLPLLAEKPLALDLNEAREIVAARRGQRVCPLSVGFNFRYLPVSREIRRLVANRNARRARLRHFQRTIATAIGGGPG